MDLISRQDAIETIIGMLQMGLDERDIVNAFEEMPSVDAVEVVRCKDCKYWDLGWKSQEDPLQKFCPMIEWVTEIDFYCAYAERKTDE